MSVEVGDNLWESVIPLQPVNPGIRLGGKHFYQLSHPTTAPTGLFFTFQAEPQASQKLTENSMFFLSWFTARGSGMASVCLVTDTDSPDYRTRYEKLHQETSPSPGPAPTLPQPSGLTCQDGLVHSKCGRLDLDEAEVRGYLVSHCTGRMAGLRMVWGPSPSKAKKAPRNKAKTRGGVLS